MKRALPIVVLLILAGIAVYVMTGENGAPPPAPPTTDATGSGTNAVSADATASTSGTTPDSGAARRTVDTGPNSGEFMDPVYAAALAGFRGRVLDSSGAPVDDKLVHLYAFSADSIFVPNVDVFVDATAEPRIDGGETRTDPDGRFEILRVPPRGMFLLHAAVDHDTPAWRIVQRSPGPGEVIDLGDIVLADLGVLTGVVVDPDGAPVEGALVRAIDLPGTVLTFVPLERLDPEGALIVTEDGGHVIPAPPWFKRRFEQLPLARTTSGPDGQFRLTGVIPGSNLVAVTKTGLSSNVRPRVLVEAGEEKDLGRLRLPEGEFAYGKVTDEEGEPIAGAEVLIASTSPSAPVHLASFAPPTNAEGVFEMGGFPSRDAVVAARRAPSDPWHIVGPQPVAQDFEVKLPSRYTLTLTVRGPEGEPITEPRLQFLPGELGEGALEMAMWGVSQPVDLSERLTTNEEGATVVSDLQRGRYAVLVSAAGCATSGIQVELTADAERIVDLAPRVAFAVQVLDPANQPVRRADVYVEARGSRPRMPEMPLHAGRTNREGMLEVDDVKSEKVRVVAMHPAYGQVREELELPRGAPLVLRFAVPANIEGVLTEAGAVPTPGKWTVAAVSSGASFDGMPRMSIPDQEGSFRLTGLTPGRYTLVAMPTLDIVTSPGKLMEFVMGMSFRGSIQDRRVELAPGETAQVAFDAIEDEPIDGPAARITGFVTIDGRPAAGRIITGWGQGRRLFAEVDEVGRFDLGLVPVGSTHLELQDKPSSDPFAFESRRGELWQQSLEIQEGVDQDLVIEIQTSSIAGDVFLPDGGPAAQAQVRFTGRIPDGEEGSFSFTNFSTTADDRGHFEIDQIAAATYEIDVSVDGFRGSANEIVAAPGAPVLGVRIELHTTFKISGTVDLSVFGDQPPRWVWLQLTRETADGGSVSEGASVERDGTFEAEDLEPGSYAVTMYFHDEEERFEGPFADPTPILVVDRDVAGVALRPRPAQEHPSDNR